MNKFKAELTLNENITLNIWNRYYITKIRKLTYQIIAIKEILSLKK